jgi:hypothetical protein
LRADPCAFEDQTKAASARPRQSRQRSLKVKAFNDRHSGALRDLIHFCDQGAQVMGNMTG